MRQNVRIFPTVWALRKFWPSFKITFETNVFGMKLIKAKWAQRLVPAELVQRLGRWKMSKMKYCYFVMHKIQTHLAWKEEWRTRGWAAFAKVEETPCCSSLLMLIGKHELLLHLADLLEPTTSTAEENGREENGLSPIHFLTDYMLSWGV